VLNLEFIWDESQCKTPLLGLLSSGADPTSNIQTLAKKKNIDLFIVSMGQGQEILARRYLQQTITLGGWLLLQNAHLGLDYLEEFYESKSYRFEIEVFFDLIVIALMATENFESSFRV
jgi:dynein heavy chain